MDPKRVFESRLLDSLVNEIIVDVALEAHANAKKKTACARNVVKVILTKYISTSSANGVKPDYYSNNPLFECLVCARQVSSNRYATHLEKCMGAGSKSARKSSTRSAKVASNAVTQRILHGNSCSSSPMTRASPVPRKRAASPATTSGTTEKSVKRERPANPSNPPDTPKSSTSVSASISTAADMATNSQPSTPSKPSKPKEQVARSQGQEDELFDENDFASGFSSDPDDSSSGDASDLEEVVLPQDDGLEEVEFEEDEENDSDAGDGELDAEDLDSDDDASDI